MVKPFSRKMMLDAPKSIHGLFVIVQTTSPTNRLSSNITFVTAIVPLISSALALSAPTMKTEMASHANVALLMVILLGPGL
jgi:hypothetical protein